MKKVLSFLVSGLLALGLFSCADGSVSLNYTDLHDLKATKLDLSGLYFRGTPNSWNATALTEKTAKEAWTVEFAADAADIAFKFSDKDWSKANTYNDSYMVAGTLPTGAKLTNTDDGNGSTNAKITGLSKDSKYKMTVTATNDGKLTIDLDSANYTLFSLSGYSLVGTLFKTDSWNNKARPIKWTDYSEDENHTLTYTYDFNFTNDPTKNNEINDNGSLTLVDQCDWNNKFQANIAVKSDSTATSSKLGKSDATVLRYRRVNSTPMALNTETSEYVDYSKSVTYRVPDYYTTDGNPSSAVSTKEAGKLANDAEFEKTYIALYNATGKKIVSVDPTQIEDGKFAEKWATLTADDKKAYYEADTVATTIANTTVGKPGKVVETADNNYYPSAETSAPGDLPDEHRNVTGLIAGQPYRLTLSVTTKGVVTATIEELPVTVAVVINGTNGTPGKEYTINGDLWKDVKATAASDGAFRFAAATFETRANYTFSKKLTIKGDGCNWSGDTVVTYKPVTTSNKTFVATTYDVSAAKPTTTALAVASKSDLSMRIVMKVPDDIAALPSVEIASSIAWGGIKSGSWAAVNNDADFGTSTLTVTPNATDKTITFFISADFEYGDWAIAQAPAGTNFKFQFSYGGYDNNGGWFNITSDSVQNFDYADKK